MQVRRQNLKSLLAVLSAHRGECLTFVVVVVVVVVVVAVVLTLNLTLVKRDRMPSLWSTAVETLNLITCHKKLRPSPKQVLTAAQPVRRTNNDNAVSTGHTSERSFDDFTLLAACFSLCKR